MTINEVLRDRAIGHAVYLERYTKSELAQLLSILGKANDSIIEKIAASSLPIDQNTQQAMLDEIRGVYSAAVTNMKMRMDNEGMKLAQNELNFARGMLDAAPVQVPIAMVAPQVLWSAIKSLPAASGTTIDELFKAYDAGTQAKIVSTIRQGYVEGESIPKLIQRLRGTRASKYTDGVMQSSRRGAEALARTITNHISNVAAMETYKANPDLVKGIQWLATLDEATCEICGDLDGKQWSVDESHVEPPLHVNCRCTTTPVLASADELGFDASSLTDQERADMNGEPADVTSYNDWLARQDASTQDDILGPTRGAMLRSGKSLGSMVKDGKLLTLEELGAKNPGAEA